MRTYVYIDGFNFYYRAVKGTPYKWLDFNTLFQHLLSRKNEVISIKYFTALEKVCLPYPSCQIQFPGQQSISLKFGENNVMKEWWIQFASTPRIWITCRDLARQSQAGFPWVHELAFAAMNRPPGTMNRRLRPWAGNDLPPTAVLCVQSLFLCGEML